jgi:hypothetical protein
MIICVGNMNYYDTINLFQKSNKLRLRLHKNGSSSIVGSDSSGNTGEVIAADAGYNLSQPTYRRTKRLMDMLFAIIILLTAPLHFIFHRQTQKLLKNAIDIFAGKKTWVSYFNPPGLLPPLRKGILAPNGLPQENAIALPIENLQQINQWYAKTYDPVAEAKLILKNYRWLGS